MNEQLRSPEEKQAIYQKRWEDSQKGVEFAVSSMHPDMEDAERKNYVESTKDMLIRLAASPELKIVISGGKRTIELPDAETPVDAMDLDEFVRCMAIEDSHRYILTQIDETLLDRLEQEIGKRIRLLDLDAEEEKRKAA